MAIAAIAIFIIGADMLLLYFLALIRRLTTKYSKFKFYMIKRLFKSTFLFLFLGALSCGNTNNGSAKTNNEVKNPPKTKTTILTGAQQTREYLPLLKGKRIAVVGNQTSLIKSKNDTSLHLVDSLVSLKINIKKVFAPEHGFRGKADAGEMIKDGRDVKTGLAVISLYGSNKKPKKAQLNGIDLMVFDIQDVGARFYTYISTLHYVMEACAENNIPLLVLDRPNPNGNYIDGPVLEKAHQSFVGMHPVPVIYGMTIGEYAQMINGEGWLKNRVKCELKIIPLKNYTHQSSYSLPVKPSPNLPNDLAINLYPSLCFFEGTNVNAGRGTTKQFQVFGSPFLNESFFKYQYTPKPMEGAKHPKHSNKVCYGKDLSTHSSLNIINLEWLIRAYKNTDNQSEFFNSFFTNLAGTKKLQQQIESGFSSQEIKDSWQEDLAVFKKMRAGYLLYP